METQGTRVGPKLHENMIDFNLQSCLDGGFYPGSLLFYSTGKRQPSRVYQDDKFQNLETQGTRIGPKLHENKIDFNLQSRLDGGFYPGSLLFHSTGKRQPSPVYQGDKFQNVETQGTRLGPKLHENMIDFNLQSCLDGGFYPGSLLYYSTGK